MASVVTNLLSGGLLDGVSKVINSIRGKNPEDAAKLEALKQQYQAEFLQAQTELAKATMDENVRLNDIAGQNIRAEQGSKYTAWARPSVIYAWIAVIIYNYIISGLIGKQPIVMPDMFWEVSGIVITGYVFTRTGQEIASKVLGGQGGSMQLPLGVKMDSKGD